MITSKFTGLCPSSGFMDVCLRDGLSDEGGRMNCVTVSFYIRRLFFCKKILHVLSCLIQEESVGLGRASRSSGGSLKNQANPHG